MERIKFVIKNLWTTTKYDCLPEKSQKSWRKIIGFSSDANRRRNITCDLKIMKFCSVAIFPVIVYTTSNFQSSSESTCEKLSMWRTLDFDLRYFWKVVLFTFYILRLHNHSILDQVFALFHPVLKTIHVSPQRYYKMSQGLYETVLDCIENTFTYYESVPSV